MTRAWALLATCTLLSCTLLSCSGHHDPKPHAGSQTHFLDACEASCPAPYSCLCGVCSVSCTNDPSCSAHAEHALCLTPSQTDVATCEHEGSLCDVECASTAECAALGGEFECNAGRCRAKSAPNASDPDPDAGAPPPITEQSDAGDAQTSTNNADDPWQCAGSQGAELSCLSDGARKISASRYNYARDCFEPAQTFGDLCSVPTFCPAGDGEVTCVVSPDGNAYAVYMLEGEELGAPDWIHGSTATLRSRLNVLQQEVCDRALQTARDNPTGGVLLDGVNGAEPFAGPACPTPPDRGPICDGSADIRLAITVEVGFAHPDNSFAYPHGRFAFVDGGCNFYALSESVVGIITGTLSTEQEAQLAVDVGWQNLDTVLVAPTQRCPMDLASTAVTAEGTQVTCLCGAYCPLLGEIGIGGWIEKLADLGSALEPPEVTVAAFPFAFAGTTIEWPLARAMEDIPGLIIAEGEENDAVGVRFDDPTEVAAFHELRITAMSVTQVNACFTVEDASGTLHDLCVRDELSPELDAALDAFLEH